MPFFSEWHRAFGSSNRVHSNTLGTSLSILKSSLCSLIALERHREEAFQFRHHQRPDLLRRNRVNNGTQNYLFIYGRVILKPEQFRQPLHLFGSLGLHRSILCNPKAAQNCVIVVSFYAPSVAHRTMIMLCCLKAIYNLPLVSDGIPSTLLLGLQRSCERLEFSAGRNAASEQRVLKLRYNLRGALLTHKQCKQNMEVNKSEQGVTRAQSGTVT